MSRSRAASTARQQRGAEVAPCVAVTDAWRRRRRRRRPDRAPWCASSTPSSTTTRNGTLRSGANDVTVTPPGPVTTRSRTWAARSARSERNSGNGTTARRPRGVALEVLQRGGPALAARGLDGEVSKSAPTRRARTRTTPRRREGRSPGHGGRRGRPTSLAQRPDALERVTDVDRAQRQRRSTGAVGEGDAREEAIERLGARCRRRSSRGAPPRHVARRPAPIGRPSRSAHSVMRSTSSTPIAKRRGPHAAAAAGRGPRCGGRDRRGAASAAVESRRRAARPATPRDPGPRRGATARPAGSPSTASTYGANLGRSAQSTTTSDGASVGSSASAWRMASRRTSTWRSSADAPVQLDRTGPAARGASAAPVTVRWRSPSSVAAGTTGGRAAVRGRSSRRAGQLGEERSRRRRSRCPTHEAAGRRPIGRAGRARRPVRPPWRGPQDRLEPSPRRHDEVDGGPRAPD